MTVRGVIFDLGSTLMYFDGDWEDVVSRGVADMMAFYRSKRVTLNEEALAATFVAERRAGREMAYRTRREVTCPESLRVALEKVEAPPEAFRLAAEAVRVYFGPEEAAWKAYPDAKTVLKGLFSEGYRLGLLSNATDDAFVQRLVNRLGLRAWLSPTFSSAGLSFRKPLREPFDLILSRWNLPPDAVIMVGDTLSADILGAHNAGMRGVLVTTNEPLWNDEDRETIIPDGTISTLTELPNLIESWRDGPVV
jgi:HAD superfamily hydrolase (TIGR01549 family)